MHRFPKGLILSIDGRPTQDSDFPVISELSPTDKLVVRKLYGPPGTKPAPPKEEPQTLPEDADKSKSKITLPFNKTFISIPETTAGDCWH